MIEIDHLHRQFANWVLDIEEIDSVYRVYGIHNWAQFTGGWL